MPRRCINWTQIGEEYITGEDSVTLEALSEKYECQAANLRRKAAAGKWTDRRAQHRRKVRAKVLSQSVELEASHRAEMIRQAQEMQRLGMLSLERHLARLIADGAESVEVDQTRMLLKDGAEMIRKALGIPENVDVREYERLTDDERASRAAALLDRARARRDGSSADGEGGCPASEASG